MSCLELTKYPPLIVEQSSEELIDEGLIERRRQFVNSNVSYWYTRLTESKVYRELDTECSAMQLAYGADALANFDFGVRITLEKERYSTEQIEQIVEEMVFFSENTENTTFYRRLSNDPVIQGEEGYRLFGGKIALSLPKLLECTISNDSLDRLLRCGGSNVHVSIADTYLILGVEEADHLAFDRMHLFDNSLGQNPLLHLTHQDYSDLELDFLPTTMEIERPFMSYHNARFLAGIRDGHLIGLTGYLYHCRPFEYHAFGNKAYFANKLGIPNSFARTFRILTEVMQRSAENLVQWE